MASDSNISWTDHTFNIAWGCTKVSPGCANCYAETLARRHGYVEHWGKSPDAIRRTFGPKYWQAPLAWNEKARQAGKMARVFACSMCDVFDDHPDVASERPRLWRLIKRTPWLLWLILTKRPENISADPITGTLPGSWRDMPYPNVWLGVSIEDDAHVWRAKTLATVSAALRFVSYEPALGPLTKLNLDAMGINWVIYGGESGPKFRSDQAKWARAIRLQCETFGVPFFYKQGAAIRTEMHTTLDGETIQQFPPMPTPHMVPTAPKLF
jgi:protein gp37